MQWLLGSTLSEGLGSPETGMGAYLQRGDNLIALSLVAMAYRMATRSGSMTVSPFSIV